ncbi:MAG: hypothetical protein ACP5D7_05800 [Limnospira sp.]
MTSLFNSPNSDRSHSDNLENWNAIAPHFTSGNVMNDNERMTLEILKTILGSDRYQFCPQLPLSVVCDRTDPGWLPNEMWTKIGDLFAFLPPTATGKFSTIPSTETDGNNWKIGWGVICNSGVRSRHCLDLITISSYRKVSGLMAELITPQKTSFQRRICSGCPILKGTKDCDRNPPSFRLIPSEVGKNWIG